MKRSDCTFSYFIVFIDKMYFICTLGLLLQFCCSVWPQCPVFDWPDRNPLCSAVVSLSSLRFQMFGDAFLLCQEFQHSSCELTPVQVLCSDPVASTNPSHLHLTSFNFSLPFSVNSKVRNWHHRPGVKSHEANFHIRQITVHKDLFTHTTQIYIIIPQQLNQM